MSAPTQTVTVPSEPSNSLSAPSQTGSGREQSNKLYLVTFLATLFLLLFVSCAIVLRSYILRRRFQRHLDEAMAAGILLAPRSQGSRRRRFGSKPKLFDAWFSEGGDSWEEINPLSAQIINTKRRTRDPLAVKQQQSGVPATPAPHRRRFFFQFSSPPPTDGTRDPSPPPSSLLSTARISILQNPFSRRLATSPTEPSSGSPTSPGEPTTTKIRVPVLQVSVLIAMPTPNRLSQRLKSNDYDEEDPPDVAIGTVRFPHKPAYQELVIPPSTPLPT